MRQAGERAAALPSMRFAQKMLVASISSTSDGDHRECERASPDHDRESIALRSRR